MNPRSSLGLARAVLGDRTTVPWEELIADYGRIRDHIQRVIPGFENFNQRIAQDIFYLPNPARDERRFRTDTGRAKFTVHAIEPNKLQPGQYIMMTIRSHDQFNTTIYGLDDRYRGVYNGRRVIFLNLEDLAEAGLQAGQLVDLTSHFKGTTRVAKYFLVSPFEIPRGCAATYFPEANVLVPIDSVAERSNTPTSKFVVIYRFAVGRYEGRTGSPPGSGTRGNKGRKSPARRRLEVFERCYFRRISSTHDIAAMVLGKPIVVIASTPTCRSSSGVQPTSNARRV